MRIIAGKYKNRKIITKTKSIKLEAKNIRPTTEKLRAAAFNIMKKFFEEDDVNILKNKKVLDLCCGVGSFGLEALSREASLVTFIDNQRSHLEIIKLNIEKLNCEKNSQVIFSNAEKLSVSKAIYDLVFIDPPYKSNILNKIISSLRDGGWIDKRTIILIESSKKEHAEKISDTLALIDKRQYGASLLSFFQLA